MMPVVRIEVGNDMAASEEVRNRSLDVVTGRFVFRSSRWDTINLLGIWQEASRALS